jgi:hypothetical protein
MTGAGWQSPTGWCRPTSSISKRMGLQPNMRCLSEADFERECRAMTQSTSVVARFAQPARLAWCADSARGNLSKGPSAAALRPCFPGRRRLRRVEQRFWKCGSARSSLLSLRNCEPSARTGPSAHRRSRSGAIPQIRRGGACACQDAPARHEPLVEADAAQGKTAVGRAACQGCRDLCGRGGLYRLEDQPPRRDQHRAGKPWQRRWPLLAGLTLLPRLLKSGAGSLG